MRLEVLGPFRTAVTVHGDTIRFDAQPGQTIDVDEVTAAALLRDVPSLLRPVVAVLPSEPVVAQAEPEPAVEAITAAVETVVDMVEVPVVAARSRQVARKPIPKATSKPKVKKGK